MADKTKITFPQKPWKDKDRYFLIPGLEFTYNASLNKWIPLTPDDSYTQKQLDIVADAVNLQDKLENLADIIYNKPNIIKGSYVSVDYEANTSDLFYNINNGKLYSYDKPMDTWVQVIE